MYNLKQRITVGVATFAIAASTLGAVPTVVFAEDGAETLTTEDTNTAGSVTDATGATTTDDGTAADEGTDAGTTTDDEGTDAGTTTDEGTAADEGTDAGTTTDEGTAADEGDANTEGDAAEEEVEIPIFERLAGKDAYDTMAEIIKEGLEIGELTSELGTETAENPGFTKGGTVVVATGDGYWDALAASSLAGLNNSPIVMTGTNVLKDQTKAVLAELEPSEVLVMGGKDAVSNEVVAAIKSLTKASVTRVAGKDAADTAVQIYNKGKFASDFCIVATSDGYWDALSIAPYAYAKEAPIFLTVGAADPADRILPDAAVKAIQDGGFSTVYITGGSAAVSTKVEEQLSGLSIKRLGGKDAIATSGIIAQETLKDESINKEGLSVATTEGFYDALTGAALTGSLNSALVLTHVDGGYEAIDAVYDAKLPDIVSGYIFGGKAAISETTEEYLNEGAEILSFFGTTDKGFDIVVTPGEKDNEITLAIYKGDSGFAEDAKIVSGTPEYDEETAVFTMKDGDDSISFTISAIEDSAEAKQVIDLGDEYGKATLEAVTKADTFRAAEAVKAELEQAPEA